MSEPVLKPFTGELDKNTNSSSPTLKPFTGVLDGETKGVKGHLKDFGASLAAGAASLPDIAIGVADIYTQGRAGKAIDDSGIYKTGEGQKYWDDKKTDIAKAQAQEFAEAEGIVDKTKVALSNPSLITNTVAASVAPMVAGGIAGRMTGIANPVAAGAVGEGLVMAGSQAEQIRQNTDDGLLNNGQEAVAVGTGVLGSLFGYAGGRLAQKMGIGDVDTMMVTGRIGPNDIANEIASMPAKSLPRRMIEGAIQEGFLEELPQSVSEQILQNLALDKPWSEGVEDAAVMGT